MILLRAGGEFCNLAKVELDLIAQYKQKLGNSVKEKQKGGKKSKQMALSHLMDEDEEDDE